MPGASGRKQSEVLNEMGYPARQLWIHARAPKLRSGMKMSTPGQARRECARRAGRSNWAAETVCGPRMAPNRFLGGGNCVAWWGYSRGHMPPDTTGWPRMDSAIMNIYISLTAGLRIPMYTATVLNLEAAIAGFSAQYRRKYIIGTIADRGNCIVSGLVSERPLQHGLTCPVNV